MKKKLTVKKLTLSKETLRNLSDRELPRVEGGVSFHGCTYDVEVCPREVLTWQDC